MTKKLISKFPGTCKACKNPFTAGTEILWTQGAGARHASPCPPPPVAIHATPEGPVELASVVKFIEGARDRGLKFPKLRFLAPNKQEICLSVAGEKSKYPGSVQVKLAGEWVGRVNADGTYTYKLANLGLVEALREIAKDPAAAAKLYAQLFGNCSFCGKQLTDAGSVELGYGAICARHYGLPHTPKGTPVLVLAQAN
jgi:hypothetical protein